MLGLDVVESLPVNDQRGRQHLLVFDEVVLDPGGEHALKKRARQAVPAPHLLALRDYVRQVAVGRAHKRNDSALLALRRSDARNRHLCSLPEGVVVGHRPQRVSDLRVHLQDDLGGEGEDALGLRGETLPADHLGGAVEVPAHVPLQVCVEALLAGLQEEDDDFQLLLLACLQPLLKRAFPVLGVPAVVDLRPERLADFDAESGGGLFELFDGVVAVFLVVGGVLAHRVAEVVVFEGVRLEHGLPQRDASVLDGQPLVGAELDLGRLQLVPFYLVRLSPDLEHELFLVLQHADQTAALPHALLRRQLRKRIQTLHHLVARSLRVSQPSERQHFRHQVDELWPLGGAFAVGHFDLLAGHFDEGLLLIFDLVAVLFPEVLDVAHLLAFLGVVEGVFGSHLELKALDLVDLQVPVAHQQRRSLVLDIQLLQTHLLSLTLQSHKQRLLPQNPRTDVDLQEDLAVVGSH